VFGYNHPVMVTSLFRVILAVVCFPLLGAYGLRWAGRSVTEMADLVGYGKGLLIPMLDYVGAALGVLVGLVFALQLIPSCCQRRNVTLQATGDVLLLILLLVFLADAVLPPLLTGTGISAALPPLSLVVWMATGAAAVRLAGFRRRESRSRRERRAADREYPDRDATGQAL
jgi:hypothetical protein